MDYRVHILCQEEFAEKILDKCSKEYTFTHRTYLYPSTPYRVTHIHDHDVPEYTWAQAGYQDVPENTQLDRQVIAAEISRTYKTVH